MAITSVNSRYQARHVSPRVVKVGDLILRKVQRQANKHKLSPLSEGPYIVVKEGRLGSYRLADEDGVELKNSWNIDLLRKFHA